MKISVITVVYNSVNTIEATILSVLGQSNKNIEFIIIDGCSNDGTIDVINKYKDQLSIFISEKDLGIYDAMNKGIELSTGDIIGILNSDDVYENNLVLNEVLLTFLNNNIDILYGDLNYVEYGNINAIVRKWKSKVYYNNFFEDGYVPPHPALFVKKDVYKVAGTFNLKFSLAADYEFMLRIFKKYNFKSVYVDSVFVKMRLGGATNTNFKNILKGNIQIYNSWKVNKLNISYLMFPKKLLIRLSQFLFIKS